MIEMTYGGELKTFYAIARYNPRDLLCYVGSSVGSSCKEGIFWKIGDFFER